MWDLMWLSGLGIMSMDKILHETKKIEDYHHGLLDPKVPY